MDNSINFKGAFWIHQPTGSVKRRIYSTLTGKKKQIFTNFTPDGDMLCITRKSADKSVAQCLTLRTKFKYYPGLSTRSGFDDEKPDEAKKIIANYKDKIITKKEELDKIFKLNKPVFNFSTRKKDNTIEKCMQTLNLNFKDYDIKKLNGYNEVYTKDQDKKLIATISEPGQYGFRYARIEPRTPGDEVERYAVRAGEKFSYINNPDETLANGTSIFLKHFLKAVNANKVIHNVTHL